MTGRTIKSHDPDLDQTILDMGAACRRLSLAEDQVVHLRRSQEHPGVPGAVAHMNAIRDTVAARAARLNIKPASALRLIVDEHDRLREKMGRRPNMEQLERAIDAAAVILARQATTDQALAIEAEAVARRSSHMSGAGVSALEYLRACA